VVEEEKTPSEAKSEERGQEMMTQKGESSHDDEIDKVN